MVTFECSFCILVWFGLVCLKQKSLNKFGFVLCHNTGFGVFYLKMYIYFWLNSLKELE